MLVPGIIIAFCFSPISVNGDEAMNRESRQYDIRQKIIKTPTPDLSLRSESRIPKPSCLPNECGIGREAERVVGGTRVYPGSYPWMAALCVQRGRKYFFMCGGTLISNTHLITAAHCVLQDRFSPSEMMNPKLFRIRLGDHNLTSATELPAGTTIIMGVSDIKIHPDFYLPTFRNDIALVKLNRTVPMSKFIQPICLPYNFAKNNFYHKSAIVTGWGTTYFGGRKSEVLEQAVIRVWTKNECQAAFKEEVTITSIYLCAGDIEGKRDACQADSGGPLIVNLEARNYLIGIVSFGKKCASPGYPGIYTRVTEYLEWIRTELNCDSIP